MVSADVIASSAVAGSYAGLITSLILYPIDTIKTRLQSKRGFLKSGSFRGIYRGLGARMLGTIPNDATFWVVYCVTKDLLPTFIPSDVGVDIIAGAIGEISSITVRMPSEVVTQTAQASTKFTSRDE